MAPDRGNADQDRLRELLAEAEGLNPKAMLIRDRVKELRRVKAGDLRPNPRNWRAHPEHQRNTLRGVLAEIGYADALLARELPDGALEIVDGHLRAETTPDAEVPVLVVDLNDEEAQFVLATLDPLGALATADTEKLEALLNDVRSSNPAVQELFEALAKQAGILIGEPQAPDVELQQEPSLPTECVVEIYCTKDDLAAFKATLEEWNKRDGVTINIS